MNDELIEVVVKELHHWPSCPCPTCSQERERRQFPQKRIVSLSPPAARLLNFIPRLQPSGSLAREINLHMNQGDC
jgi:hypothetical protein